MSTNGGQRLAAHDRRGAAHFDVARALTRPLEFFDSPMSQNESQTARREGTLVITAFGMIEDADDAACLLLGYSKGELIGMHGSELIPLAQRPAVAAALDRMRHGDFDFVAAARMLRKDGSLFDVQVMAQRLPNKRLALSVRRAPVAASE